MFIACKEPSGKLTSVGNWSQVIDDRCRVNYYMGMNKKSDGLEGFTALSRTRSSAEESASITAKMRIVLSVGLLDKYGLLNAKFYFYYKSETGERLAIKFFDTLEEAQSNGIPNPYKLNRFKQKGTGKETTAYLEAAHALKVWGVKLRKGAEGPLLHSGPDKKKLKVFYLDLSGKLETIQKQVSKDTKKK